MSRRGGDAEATGMQQKRNFGCANFVRQGVSILMSLEQSSTSSDVGRLLGCRHALAALGLSISP